MARSKRLINRKYKVKRTTEENPIRKRTYIEGLLLGVSQPYLDYTSPWHCDMEKQITEGQAMHPAEKISIMQKIVKRTETEGK